MRRMASTPTVEHEDTEILINAVPCLQCGKRLVSAIYDGADSLYCDDCNGGYWLPDGTWKANRK